jgi:hypothetical protein
VLAKNSSYLLGCVAVVQVNMFCFNEWLAADGAGVTLRRYFFIFLFLCDAVR